MNVTHSNSSTGPVPARPLRVSGNQLKEIYPELDGWASHLVTKAFVGWQRATGVIVKEAEKRDERFTDFLINAFLDKHRESRA
ncbi:hypothetical protein [Kosakonia cowanii]|uniref:hypothetical protein n=1 Tax=Kosakonia cowanii TaxID=208223 RepID=UPI00345BF998